MPDLDDGFAIVYVSSSECVLFQHCPNLAMTTYCECLVSADATIMALALFNCCFMFRKLKYSGELDLRQLLVNSFRLLPGSNQIISMENEGFSSFRPFCVTYYDVVLYAGLRAMELNR